LAVGSVSQSGKFPWYGERCASLLAATYSSNTNREQKVATTDLNDRCTVEHTGTSAAAPIAAGIVALLLEAKYVNVGPV
jgi:proprotein convertase subtilisin/kexin type 1